MGDTDYKLPFKEKIAYGFGDLASVLYWQTFMLYFTFFYTDVFLIPASAAATMFLVSRLWDGFNDPIMGMIADRTNTRWGKFRPYLLWLCIPFAFIGVLTFTVPDFGFTGKMIWAYTTFILIMMLYTGINIPYTALLGVISPDSKERTTVSSVKFMFAFTAGIIVSATLLPMTKQLGKDNSSIIHAEINNDSVQITEKGVGASNIILFAEDQNGIKNKTEFGFRVYPRESNKPVVQNPVDPIMLIKGFNTHRVPISQVFDSQQKHALEYKIENSDTTVVHTRVDSSYLYIDELSVGIVQLQLKAIDIEWGDCTHEFFISVNDSLNSSPVLIDSANELNLMNGFQSKRIDLSEIFHDPDGDTLKYEIQVSNKGVIIPEIHNNELLIIEDEPGITRLTLRAKDGRGGLSETQIQIIVSTDKNNPPYLSGSISNRVVFQGFERQDISLADLFTDLEGDQITYSLQVVNTARGWQRTFIFYGTAAILFFLIAFKGTHERVKLPKTQKSSIKKDLYELITNVPWLILLATTITFILFVAVRSSVTAHYFKYVIGSQNVSLPFIKTKTYSFETLVSAFNTMGQIASLIGVALVSWFAKQVGKKRAFIIIFLVAIFSTGAFYFLSAEQIGLIFFFQITGSLTGGPLSVLLWAMYADTADYAEWKRGRRATGLVFSASTMSQKFGWAFGAFVALNLMSQVGFQANKAQTPESLKGLILLFSLIPAGMGVLSVIISFFYPLNEKHVKEIGTELESRRKKE